MSEPTSSAVKFPDVFEDELEAIGERRTTLAVDDALIKTLRDDIARNVRLELAADGAPVPDAVFPFDENDRFGDLPVDCTLFGLALSGGGIRSAALCLGVTQALNKHGVLRLADYLSTVSGGGYLGCSLAANWWGAHKIAWSADPAALTRWRERTRPGVGTAYRPYWDDNTGNLSESVAAHAGQRWYFPFPHVPGVRETAMMRQLRGHADYLAPRGLAAAVRYAPALFLRAWVLNGLALAPFILLTAGLLAAWIDASSQGWLAGGWFDVSSPAKAGRLAAQGCLVLGVLLLALYVVSRPLRLVVEALLAWWRARRLGPGAADLGAPPVSPVAADDFLDLKWLARDRMRVIVDGATLAIAGAAALAVHPYIVWLAGAEMTDARTSGSAVGIAAFAGAIAGAARHFRALPAAVRRAITMIGLTIAGPLLLWLCMVALAAWISGTMTQLLHVGVRAVLAPSVWGLSGWALGLVVAFAAAPALWLLLTHWLYDSNEVALLAFYRDRLSRTFLFALHPLNRLWTVHADDLKLSEMEIRHAPYPIINVALNTAGDRAHWSRGRQCDFFSFTPKYIGGRATAYCPTRAMEDANKRLRVASAMAISGAAFSAVAGRNTIGYARFLLALFNIRLGYWLPHPRDVAGEEARKRFLLSFRGIVLGDRPGPAYFLAELLGRIRARQRFVYLTDGGHLENMGLYELVLRRCRLIIVVDAEQDDPKELGFKSMADAIRFARIDFGVQIDINFDPIRTNQGGVSSQAWAVGTIDYGAGPEGVIVYLKSSLMDDVPEDVWKYRMTDPRFPHQPTTDQFFDEEQFEAYRALGYHIGDSAMTQLVSLALRQRLQAAQES